ncbi:MAG: NAD(+) synthase, partial [Candidatus Hydrothermarchaeota archaeon]
VAEKFDIRTERIDLTPLYDKFLEILPEDDLIAKSNLKPRLRMITLYYFASVYDYLVCGSGNKSELMVGYFTKYGDGGVDLLPLGGLYKTQVRKLAKVLEIPGEIIEKPPSAGLWEGQTDEEELGITYENLDRILKAIEEEKLEKIEEKDVDNVKEMIRKSDHKRKMPEIFVPELG